MPTDEQPVPPTPLRSRRLRGVLLAVVVVLGVVVGAAVFLSRGNPEAGVSPAEPSNSSALAVTTTTIDARTEIVDRLRHILRVRDRAYRDRTAEALKTVYTTNCPCLKGDQSAIRQLIKDNAIWVGASTSVRIKNLERVNDRLWIVTATFDGSPFRIETESGQLIRSVQGRSELFRFAVSKTATSSDWLLGFAAPVDGTD